MSKYVASPLKYILPTGVTESQIDQHKNFQTWLSTITASLDLQSKPAHPFHSRPFTLYSVNILAVNYWNNKLAFLFCEYDIHNKDGQPDSEKLPGVLFIRGGSAVMLIILQPEEQEFEAEEYVILTVQPRIAAGSLKFVELPAGMIDDSDSSFVGTAAREIQEECGLEILEQEIVDLTELALEARKGDLEDEEMKGLEEDHLKKAIVAASGASDEFNPVFLVRKKMKKADIEEMRGRMTGLAGEGEKITLMIVNLRDLYKIAARDSKALSALALYEGLQRDGRL